MSGGPPECPVLPTLRGTLLSRPSPTCTRSSKVGRGLMLLPPSYGHEL